MIFLPYEPKKEPPLVRRNFVGILKYRNFVRKKILGALLFVGMNPYSYVGEGPILHI